MALQQHLNQDTREDNYKELITPIKGLVESVKAHHFSTSHTPNSEIIIGEKSPSYKTGNQSRLEISINTSTPLVKKLIFNGNCPIEKGDEINAYLFKGVKNRLPYFPGLSDTDNEEDRKMFSEREFNEEETTLYIEKLKDNEVVRTDYSVDYHGGG